MDNMLTPREAGERLRVSAKTIGRMVARGVLRGVDVGHGTKRTRIRVPESALAEFERAARFRP